MIKHTKRTQANNIIGRACTCKERKDQFILSSIRLSGEKQKHSKQNQTSDRKQFNWLTRQIRKKLKRHKNNWMEQQSKETEESFKTNIMQDVYNKVKLLCGNLN